MGKPEFQNGGIDNRSLQETENRSLQEMVKEQILQLVSRMNLDFSTRMPSETQLAKRLGVSRTTIRTVLTQLESEGKIIRRHGSGTYVNVPAIHTQTTLYPSVNMYELVRSSGYTPTIRVLGIYDVAAGEERGAKLGLPPYARITEFHSLYYADGTPCLYTVDCVDAKRFEQVDWKETERDIKSIHLFIKERAGIEIAWDVIRVGAATSRQFPPLARYFPETDGEARAFVEMEIINFDRQNRGVLLGDIYVDPTIIQLELSRKSGKREEN